MYGYQTHIRLFLEHALPSPIRNQETGHWLPDAFGRAALVLSLAHPRREVNTVFLIAPGVNNWGSIFGDSRDWPVQLSIWINTKTPFKAQAQFYFTTPLTVDWNQKRRSKSFGEIVRAYSDAGFRVNLVGHSNGTRVILDGLRAADWPTVATIHLLMGACDADFNRNGLNWALRENKVERVISYIADNDMAMRCEDTLIGLRLFGLPWKDKPLGLVGPVNVDPSIPESRRPEVHLAGYGHSTCWDAGHLQNTIQMVLGQP